MTSYAILLAGGSGSRMRGVVRDKILEPLAGIPVIAHSVRTFLKSGVVHGFIIVCRDDAQKKEIAEAIKPVIDAHGAGDVSVRWAHGGAERQDSVLSGLRACPDDAALAFVHDCARPLVREESLFELSMAALRDGAAVLAHRVKDTIKRVPAGTKPGEPVAQNDLDRSTLWAMETPQVFRHSLILAAYEDIRRAGVKITDDVAAATHAGHKVSLVENLHPNPKITEPHDLEFAAFLLSKA